MLLDCDDTGRGVDEAALDLPAGLTTGSGTLSVGEATSTMGAVTTPAVVVVG